MQVPNPVFLDYASCTPVRKEVLSTYTQLVEECYVNSEALYQAGVKVNTLVETSRKQIAKLLGVHAEEIIFTSGASEANSFAIKGYALQNKHKGNHIITSLMEHSSVLQSMKQLESHFGFEVTYLPVQKDGRIAVQGIKNALRKDTILVSIMAVNNEIGSVQPIEEIAELLKDSTVKFHVDAVQSIGKEDFSLQDIDMLTITAHKLYGVKGCGVLYKKKNIALLPLINGGQQEQGLRGGTLNAPACIVFAKTLRLALAEKQAHYAYVQTLNKHMREALRTIQDIVINSSKDACPYILNFSCTSIGSEIMLNALNSKGICLSTQSTCSSRTKAPSHTLSAMGLPNEITYGAMRVSFSHLSTIEEIEYVIQSIKEIVHEYRTK